MSIVKAETKVTGYDSVFSHLKNMYNKLKSKKALSILNIKRYF